MPALKDIRVGDKVRSPWLEVHDVREGTVRLEHGRTYLAAAMIDWEHDPAPRPLQVGDRVRRKNGGTRKCNMTIAAIDGAMAMLKDQWFGDTTYSLAPLSDLERFVPDTTPSE